MKEIKIKRIFRYFLAVIISLITVVYVFSNVGIIQTAKAESGNITITDTKTNSYSGTSYGTAGAIGQPNYSKIYFHITEFNNIIGFNVGKMNPSDTFSFPYSFNSTTFTITGGGIGGGFVYYDNNFSKIYYVFNSGNVYISSPLSLNFTSNIFMDVGYFEGGAPFYNCGNNGLSSSNGLWLGSLCADYPYQTRMNYITNIETRTTDNYNVTYLVNKYFKIDLNKNGPISKKYIITGINSEYSRETTFNNNSFSFTDIYKDAIYLNGTLTSGAYYKLLINSTILGDGNENIEGNISSNKINYNRMEIVNLTYNLSNSNGRIRIVRPDNDITIFSIVEGINQYKNYFIPSNSPIGEYFFYLDSWNNSNYENIDYSSFFVNTFGNTSSINIQYDTYNIGDSMTITYFINSSGYITLLDTNSNIKLNQSTIPNSIQDIAYFISSTSQTGIWNIKLYNSSGNLLDSDTTYINFGIVQPDTTVIIPSITPSSLIDISDNVSQIIFGKISNENGEIDDVQVTKLGNKMFSTLLLIVFIILIMAVFKKVKK